MSRVRRQSEGLVAFWCPACSTSHGIRVAPASDPWGWNGSTESPTFTPSVLARRPGLVCHSFVTEGRILFLPDCTHALAGQTVDIPAWPFKDDA